MLNAIAGAATGLFWFLALSAFEGYRLGRFQAPEGTPWFALLGTLVVTAVAVVLMVGRSLRFRAGVTATLVLCLLAGVLTGADLLDALVTDPLVIPWTFTRGLFSVSVWAALGVALTLTVTAARRAPAQERVAN